MRNMCNIKLTKFVNKLLELQFKAKRPQAIKQFLIDMSTAELSFRFEYYKYTFQPKGIAYYCIDLKKWILFKPNQNIQSYLKARNIDIDSMLYNDLDHDYVVLDEPWTIEAMEFIEEIDIDDNYVYYGYNFWTDSKHKYTFEQYDSKLYTKLVRVIFNQHIVFNY